MAFVPRGVVCIPKRTRWPGCSTTPIGHWLMCRKISGPPSSDSRKPKPFLTLNHFHGPSHQRVVLDRRIFHRGFVPMISKALSRFGASLNTGLPNIFLISFSPNVSLCRRGDASLKRADRSGVGRFTPSPLQARILLSLRRSLIVRALDLISLPRKDGQSFEIFFG
jgi:hypothetical protein